MRQSSKGEGTKIAQAAKDLNVTSVTIRRYISEFNIETTADDNGIKVLPAESMEELHEIRKLKEDGMTNPRVLELLEERRSSPSSERKSTEKAETKKAGAKKVETAKKETRKPERKTRVERDDDEEEEPAEAEAIEVAPVAQIESDADSESESDSEGKDETTGELAADGRSKHSLTCQTCGKTFEHMNPRLRDCLDCYRAKRKERRRGGGDRQRNVIQHPLAQQVADKAQQRERGERAERGGRGERSERTERADRTERTDRGDRSMEDREVAFSAGFDASVEAAPAQAQARPRSSSINVTPPVHRSQGVRNYRKAIEETRQITSNLKRRLERPDLPEGERRWLEQIYAYQLILHQGWRHLSEYKAGTQAQKSD